MSNFSSVFKQVKKLFSQHDIRVFSLDVFDTIVHRSCPPQAVLDAVDRHVLGMADSHGLNCNLEQIKRAREEAYLKCANINAEAGLDQETHVEDFFPVWIKSLGFNTQEILRVSNSTIEYELNLEEKVLFIDPGVVELVKYAVKKGIRVIYCSDMYLPGYFIDRVLRKHGVLDFFEGRYISSEYKKLKRTGNLFKTILDSENLKSNQVVHIGDNIQSDYLNSKSLGMHGVWLSETQHVVRRASLEYDYSKRNDRCSQAFLTAELGAFYTEPSSLPYSIGRRMLGPVYTSFVVDVLFRAKELNIDRVFFLAREGYALKRVYDNLAESVKFDSPPSVYIAGSRILSLLYSIDQGVGLRQLADIFSNTSHFTVKNIFSPFAIPDDTLETVCKTYGVGINQTLPPDFLEWPPFIRICEDKDLNELIAEKVSEHKSLYTRYLESVGLANSQRVMVVDVGWGGQIQDNLYRGLQLCGCEPQFMIGIYMALNEKAHQRKLPKNWKEWSLADKGHLEWNGYSCFDTVFIYEAGVRAPHGTVVSLLETKDSSFVYPVLKSEDKQSRFVELRDDPSLAQLQKGIIDFSESFSLSGEIYPDFSYKALRPYALSCLSAINRFPRFREYSWLASVGNVADLGSEQINVAGATFSNKNYLSLKSAVKQASWREFVAYNALGTFGVLVLSLIKYGKKIPSRKLPLISGVAFSNIDSLESVKHSVDYKKQDLVCFKSVNYLYDLADANHLSMCQRGEFESTLVSARYKSSLTRSVLRNFVVFRMVNLYLKVKNKHRFYNEGLALRYVVGRELSSRAKYVNMFMKKFGIRK